MVGINNVTIIGNIGSVSEMMCTNNGTKFVNLVVATTESYYTASKERKTNTQWHNVVLWNSIAELCKFFSKGDLVYVEGRLNYRKKATTEIFTEIVAKNIRVLHKKNNLNSTLKKTENIDYDFELEDDIKFEGEDFDYKTTLSE
jgi:single-strand DNA-binding protein